MSSHQHDAGVSDPWIYFQSVIAWLKAKFPHYRKEMKGLPCGALYNPHKDDKLDPAQLGERVKTFVAGEDVTNKKGIYEYVLSGDEKHLNIRAFSDS